MDTLSLGFLDQIRGVSIDKTKTYYGGNKLRQ